MSQVLDALWNAKFDIQKHAHHEEHTKSIQEDIGSSVRSDQFGMSSSFSSYAAT